MSSNTFAHLAHYPSPSKLKKISGKEMVITIHSSSIIFPSNPTPHGILQLSDSDQIMIGTHSPIIFVFKTTHFQDFNNTIDSLKNSLSQILVPYYPFAGRFRWIGGSRLELDCCAAGVKLIQASSDAKLEDFGDFEPSESVGELVPKVDHNSPIEELPLLLVQVTKFSCGGLVIGLELSHILTDGNGAITFINSWASIARGDKTRDSILQPYHERIALIRRKPLTPPRFEHVEYYEPPLLIGCCDAEEERKKETKVALLKISKEQVEELKKRANDVAELQPRPYSIYESVAGHIWVCVTKARSTCADSHQPSRVRIRVDIRRRLRPLLPDGFSGNSTLVTVAPTCKFGELITKPLSYATRKIREGTWKVTKEYAESALDFLASQEDIGWMQASYHTLGCTRTWFLGNPNLVLGCWITLPLYDADFGWGRPSYVGPATVNSDGRSFIMPGSTDDGSLIVAIRLQIRHMDDFKKFFYEDL